MSTPEHEIRQRVATHPFLSGMSAQHLELLAECAELPDVHVFHAGTRRENGNVVTSGGRVLAVTALGDDVEQARARAYEGVARISFDCSHYRRDIAVLRGSA